MLATSPSTIALDRLGATSHLDESEACPQISPIRTRIEEEGIAPNDPLQLGILADTISDEISWEHIESFGTKPIQTCTENLKYQLSGCGLWLRAKFIETSIDENLSTYYDQQIWEGLKNMYWTGRYIDPVDFVSLATEARVARSNTALNLLLSPFYYFPDFRNSKSSFRRLLDELTLNLNSQWAQLTCHHKRAVLNFWETQGFELKDIAKFDYQDEVPSFVYPHH